MFRISLCLVLILFVFPVYSGVPLLSEINHPLARLAVVSFFMPTSKSDGERAVYVVEQIERSLLFGAGFTVHSLEEYKVIRQATPLSMDAYWLEVNQRGIINPFNIKTENSQVFESIVEFETRETLRLLTLWESQASKSIELKPAVESLRDLLSIYQSGARFRDQLDDRTLILEGIPILGWLRKAGQNIVNPLVRKIIYSETVLNTMRSELKSNFHQIRQRLTYEAAEVTNQLSQAGQSVFESIMIKDLEELEFLKPLKSLNRDIALELAKDYFGTLPQNVRSDIVWYWINHPHILSELERSPNHFLSFFKNKHPHALRLVNHFLHWSQDPKIIERFQGLSELPLLTASSSLAKILKSDLEYWRVDNHPRFLGETNRRNWLGKLEMTLKFYLDPEWKESKNGLQFTLNEFLDKYPTQAEFIKKRLASIVLHNAFGSGVGTVISDDVRVFYSSREKFFEVHIMPIASRDAHPMDDTKRFIESVAKLPIKAIADIPVNDIEHFLKEPENLRWVLQIYQLKKIVGDEIVKSEIARYLIQHPQIVVQFLRKKWLDPKIKAFFNGQGNRCSIFYKGHEKISH